MQKLAAILTKLNIDDSDKYLSREFQKYGIYIAEQLGDMSHKSLYIKMAKETPRSILDQALTYVTDSHAKSPGALFMWKVKQLKGKVGA